MHTHTIFSLHAYSTVLENIRAAQAKNLKFLAMTDHYYQDGTEINQKNEVLRLRYLEKAMNCHFDGIFVFSGAEFNIGQKILYWNRLKDLTWRPIGLHSWIIDRKSLTISKLFQFFEESVEKHNACVHIERELDKIDGGRHGANLDDEVKNFLASMVKLAKEKNIWLEVNEASLTRNGEGDRARLKYWLNLAKDNGNKIYLGTDAHFSECIGDFEDTLCLLNEIDYPKNLILNCNLDQLENLKKI